MSDWVSRVYTMTGDGRLWRCDDVSAESAGWHEVQINSPDYYGRLILDPVSASPLHQLRQRHWIEREQALEALENADTEEGRQQALEVFEALCARQRLEEAQCGIGGA